MSATAPEFTVPVPGGDAARPSVLLVDDEPNILAGLRLHLRRHYAITMVPGGEEALATLERGGRFAVVISDMRMPGMDGATFLALAREADPDMVRVLLTGHADLDAAISAVNDGQIFRFLTKPCPPQRLMAAVESAVEQHRLVTAERVLLGQTLAGAIHALTGVLAIANPTALRRATNARARAGGLCAATGRESWQLEIAAMLSQVPVAILPEEVAKRHELGIPLTAEQRRQVDRVPILARDLVMHIPRLEEVREILAHVGLRYDGDGDPPSPVSGQAIPWGARALKAILDLELALGRESTVDAERALAAMRNATGRYDPEILDLLSDARRQAPPPAKVEVAVARLRPGMVLAEDLRSGSGELLVAAGYTVTSSILEHLHNLAARMTIEDRVYVVAPAAS